MTPTASSSGIVDVIEAWVVGAANHDELPSNVSTTIQSWRAGAGVNARRDVTAAVNCRSV